MKPRFVVKRGKKNTASGKKESAGNSPVAKPVLSSNVSTRKSRGDRLLEPPALLNNVTLVELFVFHYKVHNAFDDPDRPHHWAENEA